MPSRTIGKRRVLSLAALLLTPLCALQSEDKAATASVPRLTHRGLYAIWYERTPEVTELPYNTGGQVSRQTLTRDPLPQALDLVVRSDSHGYDVLRGVRRPPAGVRRAVCQQCHFQRC